MELDELKNRWQELDERLNAMDGKVRSMTADAAAGRIFSSRKRLERIIRMPLFVICFLPLVVSGLIRETNWHPGGAFIACFVLFLVAVAVNHVVLLAILRGLDAEKMTVREAYACSLRLRKHFIGGVMVKMLLAAPVLVLFGIALSNTGTYAIWGFWSGLALGSVLGVRVFLKASGEVGAIQRALEELKDDD